MNTVEFPPLNDDEWTVIRDPQGDEPRGDQSRYEAKAVTDISKRNIDDDIVLIKRISSMGGERTYLLPQEVIRETANRLR